MNYVVFDLESQNLFEDVGGRDHMDKLLVACAVTWSSEKKDFSVYWEKDVPALIAELKAATKVIGFNLRGFDYHVLQPYSPDRKSTRLNSSHLVISYAVFCLKKKRLTTPE